MIRDLMHVAFTERVLIPGKVPNIHPRLAVLAMAWSDKGGPESADIEAYGGRSDLLDLAALLGCECIISSRWGFSWWGYVETVEIHLPWKTITYTIDGLNNRVAIAYTYVGPGAPAGGQRKTTEYLERTISTSILGKHDFLFSGNELTDDAATRMRNILYYVNSLPAGGTSVNGTGGMAYASIQCKGWYKTLSWRMAKVDPIVSVSYMTSSAAEQAIGAASTNKKVMQQFTVGAADVHIIQVAFNARKVGAPNDQLTVAIYELDNGAPKTSPLVSGYLPAYLMSTTLSLATVDLNDTVLKANTKYALIIDRAAEPDGAKYYAVNINTDAGYAGGDFKIYNGTGWGARSPDADMLFKILINDQVDNTTQVANLVTTFGEFFTGCVVVDVSGNITGSYRNGDTSVQSVIESLLKAGGPNDRPYKALVTRERVLIIQEQPNKDGRKYFSIDSQGKLREGPTLTSPMETALGEWVRVQDAVYGRSLISFVAPDVQYVDGVTWTPDQGMQIKTAGRPGADELLAVYK